MNHVHKPTSFAVSSGVALTPPPRYSGLDLRNIRVSLDLTCAQAAYFLGVGIRSVFKWEAAPAIPIPAYVCRGIAVLEEKMKEINRRRK